MYYYLYNTITWTKMQLLRPASATKLPNQIDSICRRRAWLPTSALSFDSCVKGRVALDPQAWGKWWEMMEDLEKSRSCEYSYSWKSSNHPVWVFLQPSHVEKRHISFERSRRHGWWRGLQRRSGRNHCSSSGWWSAFCRAPSQGLETT